MKHKHCCVIDATKKYKDFVLVTIDEDGAEKIESYELQKGEALIETSPPSGFIKPKWTGKKWTEGATKAEIAERDAELLISLKEAKITQMNQEQQALITAGIEVELSTGTEHFDLSANDQISLMGLQGLVTAGQELIPWHQSDNTQHCKFYSNSDMQKIIAEALQFVMYNVTYFRDLRIYINSLETIKEVEAVAYGMQIPDEYKSAPLSSMGGSNESIG